MGRMKNEFRKEVAKALSNLVKSKPEILRMEDLMGLPELIRNYIVLSGFVGKPKIIGFKAEYIGGIRGKSNEPFMKMNTSQYNIIKPSTRLFYIVAKKMGIPAYGLHFYKEYTATFRVRLLGLFKVVDASGLKLDQSETVTLFNEMCVMAPASLIDERISWQVLDDKRIKATFSNGPHTISAVLTFNEAGELVDFISNDRYDTNGVEYHLYPWRTPIEHYVDINGYHLPGKAKLIYDKPDEELCYGEFILKNIEYLN